MPSTIVSYTGVTPIVGAFSHVPKSGPFTSPSEPASPVPVAQVLKGGYLGRSYSEIMSGVGGTPPYTFAHISGSLPTGTSLNTSTGEISGTATATGTFIFTIKATDTLGAFNSYSFQITISLAPTNSGYVA